MAGVRVTIRGSEGGANRSRVPGTQVGFQINTFGLTKLQEGITGGDLAFILLEAGKIPYEQAVSEWPVWTGASRDSISLDIQEVADHLARIILQAGGEKLISDPRNKSHKDYAPFIEFNGTHTAPAGILLSAVVGNQDEISEAIHAGVSELIRSRLA